jgi:hypothetical protein
MEITEASVRDLVEQVLLSLDGKILRGTSGSMPSGTRGKNGVFPDIDSAIRTARIAQNELMGRTLETRRKMIASMRQAVLQNLKRL